MVIATDHPRSRGVYDGSAILTACISGSSPLARGLPADQPGRPVHHRIIPARAGFTRMLRREASSSADHPRSRGVYFFTLMWEGLVNGSSPLARGLLPDRVPHAGDGGIIPARAGFTCRPRREASSSADHPRSRGVYGRGFLPFPLRWGSSPLARGLRRKAVRSRRRGGIIPARAGFTLADPWNPNDEAPYQTAFAFTADLALAPQSSDSVVVLQQSTRTPSEP